LQFLYLVNRVTNNDNYFEMVLANLTQEICNWKFYGPNTLSNSFYISDNNQIGPTYNKNATYHFEGTSYKKNNEQIVFFLSKLIRFVFRFSQSSEIALES